MLVCVHTVLIPNTYTCTCTCTLYMCTYTCTVDKCIHTYIHVHMALIPNIHLCTHMYTLIPKTPSFLPLSLLPPFLPSSTVHVHVHSTRMAHVHNYSHAYQCRSFCFLYVFYNPYIYMYVKWESGALWAISWLCWLSSHMTCIASQTHAHIETERKSHYTELPQLCEAHVAVSSPAVKFRLSI